MNAFLGLQTVQVACSKASDQFESLSCISNRISVLGVKAKEIFNKSKNFRVLKGLSYTDFSLKKTSLEMMTVWKILTADNQWKAEWKVTTPSSCVKP